MNVAQEDSDTDDSLCEVVGVVGQRKKADSDSTSMESSSSENDEDYERKLPAVEETVVSKIKKFLEDGNEEIEDKHWFFSKLENKQSCYEFLNSKPFQPRTESYTGDFGSDGTADYMNNCQNIANISKKMVKKFKKEYEN